MPDEYLGRMFSLDFAGFELVQSIGIVVIGLLIDAVGVGRVGTIVFVSAFIALIPTLIWIWIVQRLEGDEAQRLARAPELAVGG